MSRRVKEGRRLTQRQVTVAGLTVTVEAVPWCDCEHPEWKGLTRRGDGIWVRACCMRRPQHMFDKFADNPVPIGNINERNPS